MSDLPIGTVTFLFTDIEGSTRLWEENSEAMHRALAQHDALLRGCIESHGGRVFKTVGDAFCAAFPDPRSAVDAAVACQQGLSAPFIETDSGARPLTARMAIHTGVVEARDGDYFGQPMNRVARLRAIAHGGQALLSAVTRELLGSDLPARVSLQDRGSHRLRDLSEPVQVFQLLHPELRSEFPPLRSLSTHPNNLPQQLTSFVGREKETGQLAALFDEARLVTVTGTGGCGKTRLALQVAVEVLERFQDGVWLVELAGLADPFLVPHAVRAVLGIGEGAERTAVDTLVRYLVGKRALLILDNCEHLVAACSRLAAELVRACPNIRILATSREALATPGEVLYQVPSLATPDPRLDVATASALKFEAVELFVDRARAAQPGFALGDRDAATVASICRRLDGLPLAIELAAARVRAMSVEHIESRVTQQLQTLGTGTRSVERRHRTIRSLIDWSYDLLNEAEKVLMRRLSVFVGGWRLEAAEAVCAGASLDPQDIPDYLASLVDKSLVVFEPGDEPRYRMLEMIRQYACDRLAEEGETEGWRRRHMSTYFALAHEADLLGPGALHWVPTLEAEHDNLRAALDFCIGESASPEVALAVLPKLGNLWGIRGHHTEGLRRVTAVLEATEGRGTPEERIQAHVTAGLLAGVLGADEEARGHVWACTGQLNGLNNPRVHLSAILNFGDILTRTGDFEAARRLTEEGLDIARANGMSALGLRTNLGIALLYLGDLDGARRLIAAEARALRDAGRRDGDAECRYWMARLALHRGHLCTASRELSASLTLSRSLGHKDLVLHAIYGYALLAVACERYLRAAALLGAHDGLQESIGTRLRSAEWSYYSQCLEAARKGAGPKPFAAAYRSGRQMGWDEAEAVALRDGDEC